MKDLTAGRRTFAGRLADRQSLMIPSEDPGYGSLGQAFPSWTGSPKGAILHPPKPEIRPSSRVLERVLDRDAGMEAAIDSSPEQLRARREVTVMGSLRHHGVGPVPVRSAVGTGYLAAETGYPARP
jgi:hypothetical protein